MHVRVLLDLAHPVPDRLEGPVLGLVYGVGWGVGRRSFHSTLTLRGWLSSSMTPSLASPPVRSVDQHAPYGVTGLLTHRRSVTS